MDEGRGVSVFQNLDTELSYSLLFSSIEMFSTT